MTWWEWALVGWAVVVVVVGAWVWAGLVAGKRADAEHERGMTEQEARGRVIAKRVEGIPPEAVLPRRWKDL
jgi:hypothetical protein